MESPPWLIDYMSIMLIVFAPGALQNMTIDDLSVTFGNSSETNTHPTWRNASLSTFYTQPSYFSISIQGTMIGHHDVQLIPFLSLKWNIATNKGSTETYIFYIRHYDAACISNENSPIYCGSVVSASFFTHILPHALFDEGLFRDSFSYFASTLFLI